MAVESKVGWGKIGRANLIKHPSPIRQRSAGEVFPGRRGMSCDEPTFNIDRVESAGDVRNRYGRTSWREEGDSMNLSALMMR